MHTLETCRALIVYESMFGNTEEVARAIAVGLSEHLTTAVEEVTTARSHLDEIDLLVVGGPTHTFGLSRRQTRTSAASQGARVPQSGSVGLREWLAALVPPTRRMCAASFDTRIQRPRMPGSAARAARRRLRRIGFVTTPKAKSFFVTGTPGPLADGELERARAWGQQLGATFVAGGQTATAARQKGVVT